MGYNSSVLILNDRLYEIEQDKEFGKNLARAISELSIKKMVRFGPQVTAVETHHADGFSVVAFGGNTAYHLGTTWCPSATKSTSHEEEILRAIADQMGYRIVKKPRKKRQ